MKIENLTNIHLERCYTLANAQYLNACKVLPKLFNEGYTIKLQENLATLLDENNGIALFDKDDFIGYLAFGSPWINRETQNLGVTSPVYGYGIKEGYNRQNIASRLFQGVAEIFVEKEIKHYNIKLFAYDTEVIKSYFYNGFGMLATDKIRPIEPNMPFTINKEYFIQELSLEYIRTKEQELLNIWEKLINHLRSSPSFYPSIEFSNDMFIDHIYTPSTRVFGLFHQNKVIGMLNVLVSRNSFINDNPHTINIGDLYLYPKHRGDNLSYTLISYVNNILHNEGYRKMRVVHGTINPTALRFWDKYFTSYTYTLTRTISTKYL